MAAGLGFKTFTTGEVLTAADTNGYLMQGILVFASAAARDAAITSPQEGQFAYLKDTNVTTYYTGSAWANVDTTGMTNPMTTTGDIIYSSSGSTPARLGIGTANQVLRVNSGATAPEWATPASSSKVVQILNFQTGTVATGTTVLPNDDTIPQNTEGTQFMTLAITPTNASNILDITVSMFFLCGTTGGDIAVALFQDSTANALACTGKRMAASTPDNAVLTFRQTAGTTSATTFKVRMGNADAGTQTFNRSSYGQVVASSITIIESTP